MKRLIMGLAAGVVLSGGLSLAAPTAQAAPCPGGHSCMQWWPGQPNPAGRPVPWDANVCHDYYWDYDGVHDIGTGQFYAWRSMPFR